MSELGLHNFTHHKRTNVPIFFNMTTNSSQKIKPKEFQYKYVTKYKYQPSPNTY